MLESLFAYTSFTMLNMVKVDLELGSDVYMYLFFDKGNFLTFLRNIVKPIINF